MATDLSDGYLGTVILLTNNYIFFSHLVFFAFYFNLILIIITISFFRGRRFRSEIQQDDLKSRLFSTIQWETDFYFLNCLEDLKEKLFYYLIIKFENFTVHLYCSFVLLCPDSRLEFFVAIMKSEYFMFFANNVFNLFCMFSFKCYKSELIFF